MPTLARSTFFHNFGLKIVSVLVAVVLWVVVLGSRTVEVTKEIPLEIVTSPEVLPVTELPERVSFRLSGPKAFLRTILDRRDDPIRVNLTGAKPGTVTYRFFSDNLSLPIGVKVLGITPPSISVRLELVRRKEVPVRLELTGQPPEGFKITKAELTPPTVRIRGPESRIQQVSEVLVQPIDVSELRQSMTKEVQLDLSRSMNIFVEGQTPKISIEVEALAANYKIKNVDVHVLSAYRATMKEKTVTVFVRASNEDLQKLERRHVYAVIDLRGKGPGEYHEPVKISLPDRVGLVRVTPEVLDVTLK